MEKPNLCDDGTCMARFFFFSVFLVVCLMMDDGFVAVRSATGAAKKKRGGHCSKALPWSLRRRYCSCKESGGRFDRSIDRGGRRS